MDKPDPRYCLHKPSGNAFVNLGGRQVYLGKHGTPESHTLYRTELERWKALGSPKHISAADRGKPLLVKQLLAMFLKYLEERYGASASGRHPQGELGNYLDVMKPLNRIYGDMPVDDFDAMELERLRKYCTQPHQVADPQTGKVRKVRGWSRRSTLRHTARIVRIFKWGVARNYVKADTLVKIKALEPIPEGFASVRDPDPVAAVPNDDLQQVLPHLSPIVAAAVQLATITGMRVGELCAMTGAELNTKGDIWIYSPAKWKLSYRKMKRTIQIGRQGQEILRPWLKPDLTAPIFEHTTASLRRAVTRGCIRAFMPDQLREPPKIEQKGKLRAEYNRLRHEQREARLRWIREHKEIQWTPGQLRHNAAERVEFEYTRESAAAVLGHSRIKTTLTYTAGNQARLAERVVREIG